jgi:hypothetical protein
MDATSFNNGVHHGEPAIASAFRGADSLQLPPDSRLPSYYNVREPQYPQASRLAGRRWRPDAGVRTQKRQQAAANARNGFKEEQLTYYSLAPAGETDTERTESFIADSAAKSAEPPLPTAPQAQTESTRKQNPFMEQQLAYYSMAPAGEDDARQANALDPAQPALRGTMDNAGSLLEALQAVTPTTWRVLLFLLILACGTTHDSLVCSALMLVAAWRRRADILSFCRKVLGWSKSMVLAVRGMSIFNVDPEVLLWLRIVCLVVVWTTIFFGVCWAWDSTEDYWEQEPLVLYVLRSDPRTWQVSG